MCRSPCGGGDPSGPTHGTGRRKRRAARAAATSGRRQVDGVLAGLLRCSLARDTADQCRDAAAAAFVALAQSSGCGVRSSRRWVAIRGSSILPPRQDCSGRHGADGASFCVVAAVTGADTHWPPRFTSRSAATRTASARRSWERWEWSGVSDPRGEHSGPGVRDVVEAGRHDEVAELLPVLPFIFLFLNKIIPHP